MKKRITIITITIFLILFSIYSSCSANSVNVSTDKDLTKIQPGEEFKIRLKFNLSEDYATIQCKLDFNEDKIEIIQNEAYKDLAKISAGKNVYVATVNRKGDIILNTIEGTKGDNTLEISMKVKENVKLINDKVTVNIIDSTINMEDSKNMYINIGVQSKFNIIYIVALIVIVAIITIIIIKGKKR